MSIILKAIFNKIENIIRIYSIQESVKKKNAPQIIKFVIYSSKIKIFLKINFNLKTMIKIFI